MWAKGAGSPRLKLAVGRAIGALREGRHRVNTTERREPGLDGTEDSTSLTPRTWLQHRRLVVAAHRRGGTIFRVDSETVSASCATRVWSAAESSAVSSCRNGTTGNGRDVTRCSPPRRLCFRARERLAIFRTRMRRGGRRSVASAITYEYSVTKEDLMMMDLGKPERKRRNRRTSDASGGGGSQAATGRVRGTGGDRSVKG